MNKQIKLTITLCFIIYLLCGCEKKQAENRATEVSASTYETTTEHNPDAATASDISSVPLVYNPLYFDTSLTETDPVFWNAMEDIRRIAYSFSSDMIEANLMLCQYYRSKRDKFTTTSWNVLAGVCNDDFINEVDSKSKDTAIDALTSQGCLYEPAGKECIELTHLFASLNLLVKQRITSLKLGNTAMDSYKYDLGTWGGDCLEMAAVILNQSDRDTLTGMSEDELNEYAYSFICRSDSYFSRDNMLANIDAYNITAGISSPDEDLLAVIQKYYIDIQSKDRFELFVNNKYGSDTTLQERIDSTQSTLLSIDNAYFPLLRRSIGLDSSKELDTRVIKACGWAFVMYCVR